MICFLFLLRCTLDYKMASLRMIMSTKWKGSYCLPIINNHWLRHTCTHVQVNISYISMGNLQMVLIMVCCLSMSPNTSKKKKRVLVSFIPFNTPPFSDFTNEVKKRFDLILHVILWQLFSPFIVNEFATTATSLLSTC